MPCDPTVFEDIPIFSLLDADERAVLAEQVELRQFRARHRIYKPGDPGGKAYVVLRGQVQVVVIDDDHQEVVIDSPGSGEMFGLASMLSAAPHQTLAVAAGRHDRDRDRAQRHRRPAPSQADGRPRHAHHGRPPVPRRPGPGAHARRPQPQRGDRREPDLRRPHRRRGGALRRLVVVHHHVRGRADPLGRRNVVLATRAWDPYPFILLNLFLSMIAALQAPVIMMSQNRQDAKDRLRSELDFAVNRKAEAEITQLAAKLNRIEDRLEDLSSSR